VRDDGPRRRVGLAFSTAATPEDGRRRAVAAGRIAFADQGLDLPVGALEVTCPDAPCLTPGSVVQVSLDWRVPLPWLPASWSGALLLGIGLVVMCLLAVTALIDVSAAFLQRQQLMAVADAAAIAGAQAIDLPAYYAEGAGAATRLDPGAVQAAVESHVSRSGARSAVPGLVLSRVWSDGTQVVVDMSAPITLPFLTGLFGGQVSVESWAQLDYRSGP
jgi:hypothetical protein